MILCDYIMYVVIAAVLTRGGSPKTMMLHVVFYFSSLNVFVTIKTSNATPLLKMVMEVIYLTNPVTPFLVVTAAYLQAIDFSLKIFVDSSRFKHVRFTTGRTTTLGSVQQLIMTHATNIMSAASEKWFGQ